MNTEMREMVLAMVADLKTQGKNPHGLLRELAIEIELEAMSKEEN